MKIHSTHSEFAAKEQIFRELAADIASGDAKTIKVALHLLSDYLLLLSCKDEQELQMFEDYKTAEIEYLESKHAKAH